MPDSNISGIEAGCEQVRKYAEQTEYHERQIRELEQYLTAARSLLKEAEAAGPNPQAVVDEPPAPPESNAP